MTTSTEIQDGEKQASGMSDIQDEKPTVQAVEYAPANRIDEEFQWSVGKFIAITVSDLINLPSTIDWLTKYV